MKGLFLALALLGPQQAEPAPLPGTAWALPTSGTVLRSAPGADFPGVVTVDGETVVRTGALVGAFREVFVPQGFAIYMHADFLAYSEADGTARVTGDRVNMRLLPSLEGPLPIGQLGAGSGPLVVLEPGMPWMRLLAPVVVPLYAPEAALQPADADSAADAWTRLAATRAERVAAAVAAFRARDPEAQREEAEARRQDALLTQAERLADIDIGALPPEKLDVRRAELLALSAQATRARTRSIADGLLSEIDELLLHRTRAAQAAGDVAEARRKADEQALRRESRMLGLQLAFRGKGDALTREGSVHRIGLEDAPIYTLHTTEGEILKLMALPQVATLQALVGKRVKVDGRRLFLMVVDGPVLVVDELVSFTPR